MKQIFALVFITIGALLLLNKMGYVSLEWFTRIDWSKYALPLIFTFTGLILLLSRQKRDETFINPDIDMVMDDNAHLYINEVFSGNNYIMSGERFLGAEINTMLGGVRLDLRGAVFERDCDLKIKTILGGVKLYVPDNIRIETSSSCFIGGVKNRVNKCVAPNAHVLRIQAECILGGITIKH